MNELPSKQVSEILQFLSVPEPQPTLRTLQDLIDGYVHRIPWESFSRIVRKVNTPELTERPRWPTEFWTLAMSQGTGGTCFESNYAFWKLLEAIGFRGMLTVNDMGETRACHSAIIVELDDEETTADRYLVDVGLPLYTAIPLSREKVTSATSDYQRYSIQPSESNDSNSRYLIERNPHPRPIAYTLIDRAVPEQDYMQAVINDYDEAGLFLDKAIITRVVNGVISRFGTHEQPYSLEYFENGERVTHGLPEDVSAAASEIGDYFGIPSSLAHEALLRVAQLQTDAEHKSD
jgi:arylamine N-acetyltransferase